MPRKNDIWFALIFCCLAQPLAAQLPLGAVSTGRGLTFADPGFDDELYPIELNGYWGLLNQRGRIIALPLLTWTDRGVEGFARAVDPATGLTGFIAGNGSWLIKPEFEWADRFAEGYAVFRMGEKYGYVSKGARIVVPPRLDGALRFSDGWAAVRIGPRIAFIDRRYQPVTPFSFLAARSFSEGFAAVQLPREDLRRRGDVQPGDAPPGRVPPRLPLEGIEVEPRPGELNPEPVLPADALLPASIEVTRGGQRPMPGDIPKQGVWGYLNKAGRLAWIDVSGKVDELGDFSDGMARFRVGDHWGFLRQGFDMAQPPTYEDARDFVGGLAAVQLGGQWGFVDKSFSLVVPAVWDAADDFDDRLALVRRGELFGYVDRIGNVAVEPQFLDARPYDRGLARVSVDESFGYLNTAAQIFFDPRDARFGIVDITAQERAERQIRFMPRYNAVLELPPPIPPEPEPYRPDYRYEPVLLTPVSR